MNRLFSVLLVLMLVFCLSSCKIGESGERAKVPEEAKEIVSQFEEQNTRKDSSVVENLSDDQKKFFDTIGETTEGKKLVAYSDTAKSTLVYSCEFENEVVSKVTVYHIIKDDAFFNVLRDGIGGKSAAIVDEENKVVIADKTKEYKSKTYDQMKKEFSKFTIIE